MWAGPFTFNQLMILERARYTPFEISYHTRKTNTMQVSDHHIIISSSIKATLSSPIYDMILVM